MKELDAKLASLGIAILTEKSEPADPEQTLLECLPLFQEDRKLLALILAWLNNYGDLLHIERICAMAKQLTPLELAWLGGLAAHMAEESRRWNTVVSFVEKKLTKQRRRFSVTKLDELSIKRKGKDPHFARFGVAIPAMQPAPQKKLFSRAHVLQNHPWLRLRVLFGTNWRADIAMAMISTPQQTPYKTAKHLGCNAETVYRNMNALKEANAGRMLRNM